MTSAFAGHIGIVAALTAAAAAAETKWRHLYNWRDNTADIMEYHVCNRYFSIYKVQHHGSCIDNQLGAVGEAKASKATVFVLHNS